MKKSFMLALFSVFLISGAKAQFFNDIAGRNADAVGRATEDAAREIGAPPRAAKHAGGSARKAAEELGRGDPLNAYTRSKHDVDLREIRNGNWKGGDCSVINNPLGQGC